MSLQLLRCAPTVLATAAVLCVARSVEACGGCVDLAIFIRQPNLYWILLVAMVWFVAARVVGGSPPLPLWFLVATAVAAFAGCSVVGGSIAAGCSTVIGAWALSLLAILIRDLWRWRNGGFRMSVATVNTGALLLAVVLLVTGNVRARSPEWLIENLHHAGPTPAQFTIPPLVARGEEAVGPLINRAQQDLETRTEFESGIALTSIMYVLGQVRGARAVEFLEQTIASTDTQNNLDEWQVMACFALSEAAPNRANSTLVSLLDAMPAYAVIGDDPCRGTQVGADRWVPAAAAATTATAEGVEFALDHFDDLLRKAKGAGFIQYQETARFVADVLVFCDQPECLRVRYVPFHVRVMDERRRRLNRKPLEKDSAGCSLNHTAEEIAAAWERNEIGIRARWSTLLEGDGPRRIGQ